MAEQGSEEKTESPSQKKRDDAKKEGQVAFSKEASSAALLGAFLLLFYFSGNVMLEAYKESLIFTFENIYLAELDIPLVEKLFKIFIKSSTMMVIPFFATTIVVGVFASVAQVGINFTFKPMVPKLEKLSPLKGITRIFSKQAVSDLFKSLFKMGFIFYIGYYTFMENLEIIASFTSTDPKNLLIDSFTIIGIFVFRLFLALLALAVFDYMFQRWDLEQKLRMSKQELKEELKQSEGDPVLKSRIRQIQQQLSQARMMQDVPKADVIVKNPTHFAIAMLYDRETMTAPQIIAKGADHTAKRIIEIAEENKIIVYENPTVARGLYFQVEIGDNVPEVFFKAIAEILAFVYKTKKKRR